MLVELIAFEGFPTFSTNEVVGMPRLAQCRNVLPFNDFIAVTTLRIVSSVVAILTIMRAIALNEGFAAQTGVAGDASEAFSMESFVLGQHEGRVDTLTTLGADLALTARCHARGGFATATTTSGRGESSDSSGSGSIVSLLFPLLLIGRTGFLLWNLENGFRRRCRRGNRYRYRFRFRFWLKDWFWFWFRYNRHWLGFRFKLRSDNNGLRDGLRLRFQNHRLGLRRQFGIINLNGLHGLKDLGHGDFSS